jgi:hypothetical protein
VIISLAGTTLAATEAGMAGAETELEMTARHVRRGEELVSRQRHLVKELEARGENAEGARRLLAEFEAIQRMHMDHFTRLRGG